MSWARNLFFALAIALAGGAQTPPQPNAAEVHTQMRNLLYRYTDRIWVRIFWLDGLVVPTHEGSIVVFDDARSFYVAIDTARIAIGTKALSETMNHQVFAAKDAPLKDIEVTSEGQKLKVKGKLHSKENVPFETESTISATADGKLRLHTEKVKAAHLPAKGLMDLLGLDVAKLIDTRKVQGLTAEGDDLILDAQEMLPLPRIRGKVTAVQIAGDQMILTFGGGEPDKPIREGNYMSYRGGQLRFGKLTMDNSDMDLIDIDGRDPFDFFLDHYREQLAAGYTRITAQFGLRVYMRDYGKLHAGAGGKTAPKGAIVRR